MFEKRARQLLKQRQNSDDIAILNALISEFSKQNESSEFQAFKIPNHWDVEHVKSLLKQIDKRLYVSSTDADFITISM